MDAYLILGTPSCGRRAALCDMIARGLYGEAKAAVLISENEKQSPFDEALGKLAKVVKYSELDADTALQCQDCDVVFCVADSTKAIVEQIENFKVLCDGGVFRLIRIFGFIDCTLYASAFDECADFYDMLSHFSDCMILSNRSGVKGAEIKKIEKRYLDMCRPHIFQLEMKNGELENPAVLLVDETRRISLAFDDYDAVDELELDEDSLPEEPFTIEKKIDPYFERNEAGVRVKKVASGCELADKYKNEK